MSVSFQPLYATTYAPPTRIQVSAAKSDYILELIPGEREGRFSPEDSKAICYDSLVTDNTRLFVRKIWEVSGWYSWGCMLSDDGRRVAQIGQVSTMNGGISVLRCVRFWMDGKLVGSFTCYDLVPNLDEFPAAGPFGGGDWISTDPKEIAPQFVADEKFRAPGSVPNNRHSPLVFERSLRIRLLDFCPSFASCAEFIRLPTSSQALSASGRLAPIPEAMHRPCHPHLGASRPYFGLNR